MTNIRQNLIALNSDSSNNTRIFFKSSLNKYNGNQINNLLGSTSEKRKNRVILTGRPFNRDFGFGGDIYINKYNLKNNIKFIFKTNDFNKPRILFVKSHENVNINDLFLFDNSNNLTNANILYRNNLNIDNNNFQINLNFYKNYKYNQQFNSDYYKFKLHDFSINDVSNITNVEVINDYSNNRLINNFNVGDFSNLLYFHNTNTDTISGYYNNTALNITDDSFNFLIYNKPSANIVSSKTSNNYTKLTFDNSQLDNSQSVIFLPFKNYDYYSNKAGKILFYSNCIQLNSLILDSCSNFYTNNQSITPYKYYDTSNTIFLSLGNFMTGFTQKNLFKQTILELNNYNINKILFRSYYEPTKYIIPSELSNNYLIEKNDYSYNYIFDNILYTYVNINNLKNSTLNLSDYYYNKSDFSNNIYLNAFSNYNISDISNINVSDYSSNYLNYSYSDVCYNNITYRLEISPNPHVNIVNNIISYDFRFNYNTSFNVNYLLNIDYNDSINGIINNVNFFKIDILTNFNIPEGSVFNNVEEILIYYDPYSENTPPEFKYPNNNFDICYNFELDFLNTVIENKPGALTSTTNIVFIPEKNGSNFSKKMINGLIGLNDVPKLLSIKPYDPSILTGRGFNNQLNFQNGTLSADELQLTDQEIVNRKFESQRNNKLQNNKLNSKQRFSNLVRSRIQNRNVNRETYNSANNPPQITNQSYKTIFRSNY